MTDQSNTNKENRELTFEEWCKWLREQPEPQNNYPFNLPLDEWLEWVRQQPCPGGIDLNKMSFEESFNFIVEENKRRERDIAEIKERLRAKGWSE